jgi:hypothetical protein
MMVQGQDELKRQLVYLIENCINEVSLTLMKYILQDEREPRENRYHEVWQQSIFLTKMTGLFENPKQFY